MLASAEKPREIARRLRVRSNCKLAKKRDTNLPSANSQDNANTVFNQRASRWISFALVLVVLLLFAGIRWRLRSMPLERDEGEYAYSGQLILQGIPPYQLAYNMKLPGTYYAYAVVLRVFGETVAGIHLGVLLVNGITTLLVFFLARRLYGDLPAVAAAASYALLSTSEAALGLSGHATHFVVLMAVPGLWFLLTARESRGLAKVFAAGLCMGLAFLMKQPGVVFIVFGVQEILWQGWKQSLGLKRVAARLGVYSAGVAIPYLLTCVVLYRAGVFGKFWFWTVSYAREYGTSLGPLAGLKNLILFGADRLSGGWVVWCFAVIGIVAVLLELRAKALLSFEISLLFWSFLGVSVGFYYREHYFIVMFPAVSLLAAKAVKWCSEQLAQRLRVKEIIAVPAILFAAGFLLALYTQRAEFFQLNAQQVVRHQYGGNPFPEAVEFGNYIREHSAADAKIAVLGSEPEICFYAQRRSATGYIYTYPLMEEQRYASRMQQEMTDEVEAAKPEYLVGVLVAQSWLRRPGSDTAILSWAQKYIAENYRVVGVADIAMTTTYRWDEQAEGYVPRSSYSMILYKRKI